MNYILFEDKSSESLLPMTFTRPVAEIRVGIITIKEKWDKRLQTSCSHITRDYLSEKYTLKTSDDNILINGAVLPNDQLIKSINKLQQGEALMQGEILCAVRLKADDVLSFNYQSYKADKVVEYSDNILKINNLYDIFTFNGQAIESDFNLLTKNRKSATLSPTNTVIGNNKVFVEEGAQVECAILNTKAGNIYIGKDAEVMENSVIRGPFALCEHGAVKVGAKIYENTTVGPYSKVGGELSNVVIQAYSNKGHDGFLGNSVIGEWCNLGADTNNSNLKNNYAPVRLWNYVTEHFDRTGLQFCGLIMGDHSKCGINTMFNTGTVVGVAANIFGSGFPRNFVPSFAWGGASGFTETKLKPTFETAKIMMSRRNLEFTQQEQDILTHIFEVTAKYREVFG